MVAHTELQHQEGFLMHFWILYTFMLGGRKKSAAKYKNTKQLLTAFQDETQNFPLFRFYYHHHIFKLVKQLSKTKKGNSGNSTFIGFSICCVSFYDTQWYQPSDFKTF